MYAYLVEVVLGQVKVGRCARSSWSCSGGRTDDESVLFGNYGTSIINIFEHAHQRSLPEDSA